LRPEQIKRLAQESKVALDAIVQEYEWLYTQVYGQASGSGAGRSDSRFSRQTENTAIGALDRSGSVRKVSALASNVHTVLTDLARGLRARPEMVERPDQFPPTISPDELDRLREAKMRRESRGEGGGQA